MSMMNEIENDFRGFWYHLDTSEAPVLYYANVDGGHQDVIRRYRTWVPEEYRHRGLLWWRSQLTYYMFQPKGFVREHIEHKSQKSGIGKHTRFGALHIRRGDKSFDRGQTPFFGLVEGYLAKAAAIDHKTQSLYVGTDDSEVLVQLQHSIEHSKASGVRPTLLFDADEKRFNGSHIFSPIGVTNSLWPGFPGNDAQVNTTLYALDSIASIAIMGRAAFFVGTVTSCYSRLVYQLQVATRGREALDADVTDWSMDVDPRYPDGWFADP